MASKVAAFAIKFILPFIPLDKAKKWGAPLLALVATLNPINLLSWIFIALATVAFYKGNPFGVVNKKQPDGTTKKSWLYAFFWSFLVLIPLYFVNWIIIRIILKVLL